MKSINSLVIAALALSSVQAAAAVAEKKDVELDTAVDDLTTITFMEPPKIDSSYQSELQEQDEVRLRFIKRLKSDYKDGLLRFLKSE